MPLPPAAGQDRAFCFVPAPGSHPHDPLDTQDGSIWYTGQMANLLGRLNPRMGEFRKYQVKTPGSGQHGLVSDANGNIWFTVNFKGYIGKLDPNTGDFRQVANCRGRVS